MGIILVDTSSKQQILLLLDLVTVGVSGVAAPFFNNLKDITTMSLGQSTTLAKDLLETEAADWDEEKQVSFTKPSIRAVTLRLMG